MTISDKLLLVADNQVKIHEQGKIKGFKDLMSGIQQYGDRTNYNHAFANWHSDSVRPVHDIICKSCTQAFYNIDGPVFDLSARLKECGVKLDTSQCSDFNYAFYSCNSTTLPEIDTRGADLVAYLCPSTNTVKSIDNLILREDGSQTFKGVFEWNTSLENIKITGVIGQNGFSVSSLYNLNRDSLLNILHCLQDKTGDTSTVWTIAIGSTNKNKLTESEILIATNKGWVVG